MCHRIVSYPKAIKALLDKYASNESIIQTQDAIKNLKKWSNQRTPNFADLIRSRTNWCGSAYGQINQIEIFIHVIAHQIREQTTSYWSDHRDIDIESLPSFANGLHYAIYPNANDKNSNSNRSHSYGRSKSMRTTPSSSVRAETSALLIHHNEQQLSASRQRNNNKNRDRAPPPAQHPQASPN